MNFNFKLFYKKILELIVFLKLKYIISIGMRKKKRKIKNICTDCPNRNDCPDPCNPSSCEFRKQNAGVFLKIEYNLYEIGERIIQT